MIQLLKKDWRIYRVAILGNLVFVLFLYAAILGTTMFGSKERPSDRDIAQAFTAAASSSILATVVLASISWQRLRLPLKQAARSPGGFPGDAAG